MDNTDDRELLRQYAWQGSEAAFTALVERHINLVHSSAMRLLGDLHLAEEVTQAVFIALAQKARTFRPGSTVPGWLYRATNFAALNSLKAEHRRQRREDKAAQMQMEPTSTADSVWGEIAPVLEEAMTRLREKDRVAVLLRYFEGKSLAEVAAAMGTSDEAAKKRLARALERLRTCFARRGVGISVAALGGLLATHTIQAAPATLAASVHMLALLKSGAATGSAFTLAKATLKLMAWAKLKFAALAGVGVVLAFGAAAIYSSLGTMTKPPPEPIYQGRTLRQWIVSEPPLAVLSHEDTLAFRRSALLAMGEPAVHYLHWLVLHPEQISASAEAPDPQSRFPVASVPSVVVAIELLGPSARAIAPDLVRLWESDYRGELGIPISTYNGFPISLGELGNSTPVILGALHRHFASPDRLHRALCAFAAWRLKPNNKDAMEILRRELRTTDEALHARHALVDTFSNYATNATSFAPELRALIAREESDDYGSLDARAAWRIWHSVEPARSLVKRMSDATGQPGATADQVNRFSAAALTLAEVPGLNGLSKPLLKKLSNHENDSAARFASNILSRLEAGARPTD